MTGMRVTIHRIDADPVDVPNGPAFERITAYCDKIGSDQWAGILDFLPKDRQRTHVAINEAGWPSSSELLCEIADCRFTSAMLATLPGDGWIAFEADWRDAEAADHARAEDGIATVLVWRRPLVRLGVMIRVETSVGLPGDHLDRMRREFGDILVMQDDEGMLTFVARGMPQDIEARVDGALT